MADTETDSAGEGTTLPTFHGNENASSEIEGDIHIPGASDDEEELNTLDEAVSETLVSRTLIAVVCPFDFGDF